MTAFAKKRGVELHLYNRYSVCRIYAE